MTVPTNITDLSTTAASNPPNGSSDTPQEGDDHIRAAYSFIAQNYSEKAPKASPTFTGTPVAPTAAVDTNTTQIATTAYVVGQGYAKLASPTFTGTVTAAALTTTGNTILGDASTDTLNVGNGGIVKDASGNTGFGTTPPAWVGVTAIDIGTTAAINSDSTTARFLHNAYYNGSVYKAKTTSGCASLAFNNGEMVMYGSASTSAGATVTFYECLRIDVNGNVIPTVTATPPTLGTNSQMVFNLTSNTNLRISVRGTDGTTRTANITLA